MLGVLKRSLTYVNVENDCIDIRVIGEGEDGAGGQMWKITNRYTVRLGPCNVLGFGSSVSNLMFLRTNRHALVICNLETKELEYTRFRGTFSAIADYKGCLASIRGSNGESYKLYNTWKPVCSSWDFIVSLTVLGSTDRLAPLLDSEFFTQSTLLPCWIAPTGEHIKINTGMIWVSCGHIGSFSWIARDANMDPLEAAASGPFVTQSPFFCHGEAVRDALTGAIRAGWRDVIIESSYFPLLVMLNEPETNVGNPEIIKEIKELCNQLSVSFQYIPQHINSVAFSIALHGLKAVVPLNWASEVGEMPEWISTAVVNDY